MTTQLMLSAFSQKTISMEEATKDFRLWDNVIYDWDVEYKGYARGKDGEAEGYVDFHIIVQIVEALVKVREAKTYKKVERPGFKLIVNQNIAFAGKEWESYVVYEEAFQKDKLKKAFDEFKREAIEYIGMDKDCGIKSPINTRMQGCF